MPGIGRSASVKTLRIMDFSFSSKWASSSASLPALASTLSRIPIIPKTFSAVRLRQELLI